MNINLDASSTPLSLERRVHDAYHRARARRDGWQIVDSKWHELGNELARARNAMSSPPTAQTDPAEPLHHILEKALAYFTRWSEMPENELTVEIYQFRNPPTPPPVPEVTARNHIAAMRLRGITLTADYHGEVAAMPRDKLTSDDKSTLSAFKHHIAAELNREVYFVP